ncbi:hypothetical protein I7I48_03948 [Histoplasma ohiense]|nr:hypothetical protein I7I48_03948 [Histoplasma ohiense (nom. inval.)]
MGHIRTDSDIIFRPEFHFQRQHQPMGFLMVENGRWLSHKAKRDELGYGSHKSSNFRKTYQSTKNTI